MCKFDERTVESEVARGASIPDLGARPPSQACPRPAVKFALTNATSVFDDFSESRYQQAMAHKCNSPGCDFSLPDNYPLPKCPWHMVPGRGPVKIVAALAVAAAGLGGGLAYKKFMAYVHEKQLRKQSKDRRQRNASKSRKRPRKRKRATTKPTV